MLTNIAMEMRQKPDWLVIELNPMQDLLQSLAAKIYSIPELHAKFLNAKLDFSAFGLGVSIENEAPVTDIENVLEIMLREIKKMGKKLLITIDEVTNSEHIRIFASSFQIFMRLEAPIYLLMTGLYENIYELENHKELTFLYRAPKIMLEPLNLTAIRKQYAEIFSLDFEKATEMSLLTKGYPFAFQVLGYLTWNNHGNYREVLEECMIEMTQRHMREHPDTGAIVFECTNFGPFSRQVQDIAKVPVFGINQLLEWMQSCVNLRSYY